MVEFYGDGQFTHGCSVDHVIFDFERSFLGMQGGSEDAKRRFEITLENAGSFLKASRSWTSVFVSIKHRQHEDRREKRNLIRPFLYRSDACHAEAGEGGWKTPEGCSRFSVGNARVAHRATATSFLIARQ